MQVTKLLQMPVDTRNPVASLLFILSPKLQPINPIQRWLCALDRLPMELSTITGLPGRGSEL